MGNARAARNAAAINAGIADTADTRKQPIPSSSARPGPGPTSKADAVTASSTNGIARPAAKVSAIARRDSPRPGIDSRSATPTISSPARAWPNENPQALSQPIACMSERKKRRPGTDRTIATASGINTSARTNGGRSGRVGRRSRAIFSRSPGGVGVVMLREASALRSLQVLAHLLHAAERAGLRRIDADAEPRGDFDEAPPLDVMHQQRLARIGRHVAQRAPQGFPCRDRVEPVVRHVAGAGVGDQPFLEADA